MYIKCSGHVINNLFLFNNLHFFLYVIFIGSFGMVCKSQYCNPKTDNEIEVAVKGLRGECFVARTTEPLIFHYSF